MSHKADADVVRTTHNTARFFTENRHISWILLVAVLVWGFYGYAKMPKRKDPDIPVRLAVAVCPWPGVSAAKVEQLVTRQIEQKTAENTKVHPPGAYDFGITSTTLDGVAFVYVALSEDVDDIKKEFNDINLKLNSLTSLPQGAGPIQFMSDFGDTAALMLTVASPKEREVEIELRAKSVKQAIEKVRIQARPGPADARTTLVAAFPLSVPPSSVRRTFDLVTTFLEGAGMASDIRPVEGAGFAGLDFETSANDEAILTFLQKLFYERLHAEEIHPDAWRPIMIRDPKDVGPKLTAVAGDKYSYRELDDFTELIQRTLQPVPQVSKVDRSGVLPEQILLEYSQERLASYGLQPSRLREVLGARNINLPGGLLQVGGKDISIDPSGEFKSEQEIGNVLLTPASPGARPLYLRDLVEVNRGYQSPPRFLNFHTWRDNKGEWRRSRAVTLAVEMRSGEQIGTFGKQIDATLAEVKHSLPEDLIVVRTSDQPLQVKENIDLFMDALYEALLLVVLVAWVGFWEWRSALLMALSIPLTLAMTFGIIQLLGIDVQQVSIASLIIALGLLVDDPVVAGDAIKRDLGLGHPPVVAAWLGPTKLAKAIMFATITNIVAYLPFRLLSGDTGRFLASLPIVMACSLLASRIVSMTFIPLLGYYLLRQGKKPEISTEERRQRGLTGAYYRLASLAIQHRWMVFAGSLAFLSLGVLFIAHLKTSFFPDDLQYLSYVDVWMPNDAPLSETNNAANRAEEVVRRVAERYGAEHAGRGGKARRVLKSVTSFVGGGGPRFWMSVSPQLQQSNYAQLIIEVEKKEDTPELVPLVQRALAVEIPGARVDVFQLQTNPVNYPVEVRISGRADVSALQEEKDIRVLRGLSRQVKDIFRAIPQADRVRDDWDEDCFTVALEVDPDRANLAGISNRDVAASSVSGMNGIPVTSLREGDKQIQVLTRLRMEERAQLSDIKDLYIYSTETNTKIPLTQISSVLYGMKTARIQRRDHFRTMSIHCFPVPGVLASEVLKAAKPRLRELQKNLPPGYRMEIGGEQAKQDQGFGELAVVLAISATGIFLALVLQFNNAVKPILVFAAVPYGMIGALGALEIMGAPFGFMAFLGIASLVGVIVSHVIVLFDFIEEMHEKGEPLVDSLLDAGIVRLRPVMITVGATVLALFPLAVHGGPLWQPLCYAQIGGLSVATFIELLLVPVLYAIFVLDLKLIKWEEKGKEHGDPLAQDA
ncbi:MAG TPA: AcrB/AcrD/AcrF family protein [Syntrophobacteraceae bacterium]|nr:AcrB/AcrD/AcrF family protein [Syntrophobacteraceae bacterium]